MLKTGGLVLFLVRSTVLIVAGFCSSVTLRATDSTYDNKDAGFSMRMPENWVLYEKESFAKSYGIRANLEPTPPLREIVAVFGCLSNVFDQSFPRIVVHLEKNARVGETQFRALHTYPLVEITVAQTLEFNGRAAFMRTASYNTNTQALNFVFTCRGPENQGITALASSFLTADGLLNVYCYAPEDEFEDCVETFRQVIGSVRIAPEHQYHSKPVVRSFAEKASDWLVIGKVIGVMALAGCARVLISRFSGEVRTDEV